MTRIWHHFHGRKDAPAHTEICATLRKVGVHTYPLDPNSRKGPGILFVDEVTPSLCHCLRDLSSLGAERVLLVSVSQTSVKSGIWSLLRAGASDVLNWGDGVACAVEIAQRFERWGAVDGCTTNS